MFSPSHLKAAALIRKLLRAELHELTISLTLNKAVLPYYYDRSEKGTYQGELHFQVLNVKKDENRRLRKKIKEVTALLTDLKGIK